MLNQVSSSLDKFPRVKAMLASPRIGKHGKQKKTLLREKAQEKAIEVLATSWEEKLKHYLPEDKVLKVASEGLDSMKVFSSHTEPDKVIVDYQTRHRYLETALEILGKKKAEQPYFDVRVGSLWLIKK